MELVEVFKSEFIKPNMEALDKEEAFEELVDHFCTVSGIHQRDEILEVIQEREQKMSTGVKTGIAIPHGKTNVVNNLCGVIGISRPGIDYDALDGRPVYLVFLLLSPERDSEQHLRLIKRLAELLENPQFYTEMAAQTSASGAFATLKKYEGILKAV
jgi:PTS system fructose-specific IIC component/PTS system nitrogen regulatory IIA component